MVGRGGFLLLLLVEHLGSGGTESSDDKDELTSDSPDSFCPPALPDVKDSVKDGPKKIRSIGIFDDVPSFIGDWVSMAVSGWHALLVSVVAPLHEH